MGGGEWSSVKVCIDALRIAGGVLSWHFWVLRKLAEEGTPFDGVPQQRHAVVPSPHAASAQISGLQTRRQVPGCFPPSDRVNSHGRQ